MKIGKKRVKDKMTKGQSDLGSDECMSSKQEGCACTVYLEKKGVLYLCLNHGMNDRLRMNNNINVIIIRTKEIMCLYHLQTLS
jgi:hypothetical protein